MTISVSTGTTAGRATEVWGRRRVTFLEVTMDSSYPTGGETLDLTPYVTGTIFAVLADVKYTDAADDVANAQFIRSSGSLSGQLVLTDFDSEVGNGVNIADTVIALIVIED